MAKNIGKLAGLAALAGAAYMMSKGKDKGKSDDAGDQKTSSYTGDTKKVESDGVPLKTPAQSIAAADKSDKSTSISTKGESGTTTPGPDKSAPDLNENRNKPAPPKPKVEAQVDKDVKPKSVSEPSDKSVRLAPENRDLEKNTSRGIPAKQKPVSTVSSSEAGMKDYKPRRTPAASTSSSSAEGMKNYKPRSTQPSSAKNPAVYGLKEAVKTATQGPATSATSAASPAMRETYRDLSGKVQYKTPDIPSAAKTASDAVVSGAKKVGSGIADYASKTFTLEGREKTRREAKEAKNKPASVAPTREYNEDALSTGSAMRRGGKVKKMASGGMTASRRADGIASRGKTRCKMY